MRKIHCYTPGLLDLFEKDYIRDTNKFIRASRLEKEHLGVKFKLKSSEYTLIGRVDDKDLACLKDDGSYWAIERILVQRIIIGETNSSYVSSSRRLRKIEKDEVIVPKSDVEIEDTEDLVIDVLVGSVNAEVAETIDPTAGEIPDFFFSDSEEDEVTQPVSEKEL
jgi:hypothetical protein